MWFNHVYKFIEGGPSSGNSTRHPNYIMGGWGIVNTRLPQTIISDPNTFIRRLQAVVPIKDGTCPLKPHEAPQFVLTPRFGWPFRLMDIYKPGYNGACERLAQVFELPDLSKNKHFAYCVQSKDVLELAVDATKKGEAGLSSLKHAAILEELFIW